MQRGDEGGVDIRLTEENSTPGGCHYRVRIPRFGRDLVYDRRSTEVLVPSVGIDGNGQGEVYRLNLVNAV